MKDNARKPWLGLQIQVDAANPNHHDFLKNRDVLKSKLEEAKRITDFDGLLIWSHGEPKTFDTLRDLCTDLGVETYLWNMVLADVPNYEIPKEARLEGLEGPRGLGDLGRWEGLGVFSGGREKLEFMCPNNEEAVQSSFEVFQDLITNFDGVFLDRIRFPSAAMGLGLAFTCFCLNCQKKFRKDFGGDLLHYRDIARLHVERLRSVPQTFFEGLDSLKDVLYPREMEEFLYFRNRSIQRVVGKFSDYARQKGKRIGLDLYSFSLSDSVSQNYEMLSETCDWIKPMFYCHANLPAGFACELECLARSLKSLNPKLDEKGLLHAFGRILNIDMPESGRDLLLKGVTESVIVHEMRRIGHLHLADKTAVYPGIEIMKMGQICMVTEEIMEAYLQNITSCNVDGLILSWDLLEMPFENLRFLGSYLNGLHRV